MQRVRGDALQRAQGALAQGAVLLRGDHGSGRTSLLAELVDGAPARWLTAVRLDLGQPAAAREALGIALGCPIDVLPSPAEVAVALDGAVLAVDDAQWLGPELAALLVGLVGHAPLAVTVATEDPESADLEEALRAVGVEVVELDPVDDATADALLGSIGVDTSSAPAARADAGGNLALLAVGRGLPSEVVADGVAARLAALGSSGVEAAVLLHLAGRPLPSSALETSGLEALTSRGWAHLEGGTVRLVQGAVGRVAAAELAEAERRRLHATLADHVDGPRRAHHLEAAGRLEEAASAAQAALEAASVPDRPALLELIGRCAGPDPGRDAALAAALLAAGRPAEAIEAGRSAAADEVVLAGLRQSGRVAEALEVVAAAGAAADLRTELAQLAAWPGIEIDAPSRPRGSGTPATLLAAVAGETDPAALLDAATERDRAGAWDDAGRLAAAAVVSALVGGGAGEAQRALEHVSSLLTTAPSGPWHRLLEGASLLVGYHGAGSDPGWAEAATALVDADHALPGVLVAHAALGLSDLGRSSDALALLDQLGAGARAPHGWDGDLAVWARAEVELTAGRPRRARQQLDLPPRGPTGPGLGTVLAHLRTSTEGWVAIELGEAPPTAAPGAPRPLAVEVQALVALHEERPEEAATGFDEAAASWPSRRAARRAAWGAAEARRRAGLIEEAVAGLRALEAEAEAAGALPLLARVRSSLRRAGVRTRPTPQAQPSGQAGGSPTPEADSAAALGLSPREHEALRLVAEGLPSGQIAERLGVGRSTVETQVASAMRKLGARTRRQAAALLVERSR